MPEHHQKDAESLGTIEVQTPHLAVARRFGRCRRQRRRCIDTGHDFSRLVRIHSVGFRGENSSNSFQTKNEGTRSRSNKPRMPTPLNIHPRPTYDISATRSATASHRNHEPATKLNITEMTI